MSERFSIKFFSAFLKTPRPIAMIPGVGQIGLQQMGLGVGIGLLVGWIFNILIGPVAFFVMFAVFGIGSILVLSREHDHIQIGERIVAACIYQFHLRFSPGELIFIPSDESFNAMDIAESQPVLMLDEHQKVVSLHRGGQ